MKTLLQHIQEGLLDDDFDVSVEPLNMDNIHNKSLFGGFKWVLEQPNEVLMYYQYLKNIVDAFDEFDAHLDKNHYQKSLQYTINSLEKPVYELRNLWASQKVLDNAIKEINHYSKPVNALLELDEQMHKACGSNWDKIRFMDKVEDIEFGTGLGQCDQKVLDKIQQISIKGLDIEITDKQLIIKIV